MRWKVPQPKEGDLRNITKFLLFPKWVGGEIRWLELATFTQSYQYTGPGGHGEWSDLCWADDGRCIGRVQRIKEGLKE